MKKNIYILKNISFHQNCKCGCLLNEKLCNNLQKWNKDKCRCEWLKIKKCKFGYSWNVSNFGCEIKKLAALIQTEKCDIETDKIKNISEYKSFFECKEFSKNKTVTLIKKVNDCKPFVTLSILFLCASIILTGTMIYFYLKLRNSNVLPY